MTADRLRPWFAIVLLDYAAHRAQYVFFEQVLEVSPRGRNVSGDEGPGASGRIM